ncbi:MAG TPA: molybdenum cofactor guanylyltransferase [Sphingomicrobium sp.]|nr:molybdenum cofactor guanylyltransferase [Sphingomicrobium sp.]
MTADAAVVILAGGEGSRIGGAKPLQLLAGERLIDRALRMARGWSDVVAIVVRHTDQAGGVDVPILVDEDGVEGPLAGLIAAIGFAREIRRPFVLTIAADMPFLPRDLLQRLRIAIGESACAIARSGGHLHPVCGLWRVSALASVDPYLGTGKRSLKGFAEAIGFVAVEWPAKPSDAFFNINDTVDLDIAERLAAD